MIKAYMIFHMLQDTKLATFTKLWMVTHRIY